MTEHSIRLRHIRPTDHRRMPWKNGLGTTAEIAVDPPGAGISGGRFRWRLSIASVDRSCAFSAFPGYERTIMAVEGNGMILTVAGQAARRLDRLYEPFVFSGDDPVDCQLIDGPIRDFNLMVDRAVLTSRTTILSAGGAPRQLGLSGETAIMHCLAGTFCVCPAPGAGLARLAAGDTLIVEAIQSDIAEYWAEDGRSVAAVMELAARNGGTNH